MVLFFVLSILKADAHFFHLEQISSSLKWWHIFLFLTSSIALITTPIYINTRERSRNARGTGGIGDAFAYLLVVVFCILVFPFLLLLPLKLDGILHLHFWVFLISFDCMAVLFVVCVAFSGCFLSRRNAEDFLRSVKWELSKNEFAFCVERFLWLRKQFGLPDHPRNEKLHGFAEKDERRNEGTSVIVSKLNLNVSIEWICTRSIESTMELRKGFYALPEGNDLKV
ncbi:uncharacterized protein MONOS_18206 [Monocercomonoides exilis]|uniref:uncharacterized protein n=1 Tax=Monocercomonoides exilis TaxID=2049356 RepID=UPI00355A3A1D|nr:hypothetical protein MONOS_18206 [Monocercomonoides exilis]